MREITITMTNEEQDALRKALDPVAERLRGRMARATEYADHEAHAAYRPLEAILAQMRGSQ